MADLISEHGPLPETPTVATGGNGVQHYFRYPEGALVRSRAGVAKGIDVRGDAGYVLAPPSTHLSGKRYEWVVGLDTPLADAPDWLLALACERPTARTSTGCLTLTMGSDEANDLATHPGAGEGRRNDTLCRLVGVHLHRGDSPATVEALALAWARRCDPPMPEAKVLRVLRWAEGKRVAKVDSGGGFGVDAAGEAAARTNELTLATSEGHDPTGEFVRSLSPASATPPDPYPPLPTPHADDAEAEGRIAGVAADADWPTLRADAYHGLAGAIVRAIEPETEADPAGLLVTLLAAVGNAVGKGPHFAMNAGVHHANLFAALVGDTASGRRGRSCNR